MLKIKERKKIKTVSIIMPILEFLLNINKKRHLLKKNCHSAMSNYT